MSKPSLVKKLLKRDPPVVVVIQIKSKTTKWKVFRYSTVIRWKIYIPPQ